MWSKNKIYQANQINRADWQTHTKLYVEVLITERP